MGKEEKSAEKMREENKGKSPKNYLEALLGAASDGAALFLFMRSDRVFDRDLHEDWLAASHILAGAGFAAVCFNGGTQMNPWMAGCLGFAAGWGLTFAWSTMSDLSRQISYGAGTLLGIAGLTFGATPSSGFGDFILSGWLMAAWLTYVVRFAKGMRE